MDVQSHDPANFSCNADLGRAPSDEREEKVSNTLLKYANSSETFLA